MEMDDTFNNSELLELVEEEIEKVAGGKIDVKMGATRVLATALSALSLAGGVNTQAMKPHGNSAPGNSNGSYVPVGVSRELGEYTSTKQPVISNKELGFVCSHFDNFKIHSDGFWEQEDVSNFLAAPANEVIKSNDDQALQKFQSVLNVIFRGNYNFSKSLLDNIAEYIDLCMESQRPVTRRGILSDILKTSGMFSLPRRSRHFRPHLYREGQSSVILNDFPENFLNLPQVEKEFSFPDVRRDIPYDSMLAYISDLNYMEQFVIHAESFVNYHVPSEREVHFNDRFPHVAQLRDDFYKSQTLEEARVNFYKLVDFLKKLLGSGLVDLFGSFNNYGIFKS